MNSESLGKLAEALAKAQGEMENAAKDKDNPFFKSSYADLTSVWDACRGPLSKNGLSVVQCLGNHENKTILISKLMHMSGEWIDSIYPIQPIKPDPQSMGSAITYARRFALSALVGISPAETEKDDDGNKASARPNLSCVPYQRPPVVPPENNHRPQISPGNRLSPLVPRQTQQSEPPDWVKE